jgi:starvation-inducible outer membrane lipoprotein
MKAIRSVWLITTLLVLAGCSSAPEQITVYNLPAPMLGASDSYGKNFATK